MFSSSPKKLFLLVFVFPFIFLFCKKKSLETSELFNGANTEVTLSIQNVLNGQPLVESGTFNGAGAPPVIQPGESTSFSFAAGKGQTLTFVCMYSWSNDLFFAPANPGIALYDSDGKPVVGDISAQIRLWDNGTRINQTPGPSVVHPGPAETKLKPISEVNGIDAQGHTYPAASTLMKATLAYGGNSTFTLTIENRSGASANPTAFSPGVWAISYRLNDKTLDPCPLFRANELSPEDLTFLAERGNNARLKNYLMTRTGTYTPLSPVLAVLYNGISNPIYKAGGLDKGKGLKELSQLGDAQVLAAYLKTLPGVKQVCVLSAPNTQVLLPMFNGQGGDSVAHTFSVTSGDRLAIASRYCFSNDWFFASWGEGVDATQKGDISSNIGLFESGTAIDQFPGAGITRFNSPDMPLNESKPITPISNPNAFTTLPDLSQILRVTLK